MAADKLLIAGGGLLVFAAVMMGFMIMSNGQDHRVTVPPMEGTANDELHAKINGKFADLERRVGTSFSQIGDKLDLLAAAAVATQGNGAAAPAATAAAVGTNSDVGADRFAPIPADKGAVGREKKPAFASFGAPQSVTKPLAHTTAHICSGRDFMKRKIPHSDQHASCYFRHLCVAPGEGPAPQHFRTRGHFDWYYVHDGTPPPDSVNFTLGVGPHMVDHKVLIAPKAIAKADFDKKFPLVRIEPTTSHIFYEFNAENFGHALTDVIMPMYSIMAGFNQLSYDNQMVKFQMTHDLGFSCDYQRNPGWGDAGWIPDRIVNSRADKMCNKFYEMIFPGISSRPLVLMEELFGKNMPDIPKTPVCFEKLLVGTPMLSDDCMEGNHGRDLNLYSQCMTGRMEQMWNFRTYVKTNLGVADVQPKEHHIVIWQRGDGKRGLRDLTGLGDMLKDKFKVKVTLIDWATISIEEQLRLIGSATIHITGPGGGSFIAIFLPRGATSIRLYSQDYGMEFHFFNYLGYIHNDYRHAPRGVVDRANVADLVQIGMHRFDSMQAGGTE